MWLPGEQTRKHCKGFSNTEDNQCSINDTQRRHTKSVDPSRSTALQPALYVFLCGQPGCRLLSRASALPSPTPRSQLNRARRPGRKDCHQKRTGSQTLRLRLLTLARAGLGLSNRGKGPEMLAPFSPSQSLTCGGRPPQPTWGHCRPVPEPGCPAARAPGSPSHAAPSSAEGSRPRSVPWA